MIFSRSNIYLKKQDTAELVFETLSGKSTENLLRVRLSQLLHLLLTREITGNWTPLSAQEI